MEEIKIYNNNVMLALDRSNAREKIENITGIKYHLCPYT